MKIKVGVGLSEAAFTDFVPGDGASGMRVGVQENARVERLALVSFL